MHHFIAKEKYTLKFWISSYKPLHEYIPLSLINLPTLCKDQLSTTENSYAANF